MEDATSSESSASGLDDCEDGEIGCALASLCKTKALGKSAASGHAAFKARPGEKVIEYFGGEFAFSKIEPGGVLTGYGVRCGRHVNESGHAEKTSCQKAINTKHHAISEAEARIRLKRWLVAGLTQSLDPAEERQAHIHLGGRGLNDFGTGSTWDEFSEADLDLFLSSG